MAFSLRSYARHRGCSLESVRRAVLRGRLEQSIERTNGRTQIRDFQLADHEWERNTEHDRKPIAIQIRDARRRAAARPAPSDDPIPFEQLSVTVVDPGLLCMINTAADDENEGYVLTAECAEQLAALLLDQAARARRFE